MKYRKVGSTDLLVSEVGFGVWTVSTSGWPRLSEQDAVKLLQTAHSLGVTLFDTADVHGEGYGEEILAKALQGHRHDVALATKVGYDFYKKPPLAATLDGKPQELSQNFSAKHIKFACERSLKRLRSDYIDLYQLHKPPLEVLQQEEVFGTLKELQKEGKIRYFGAVLSNTSARNEDLKATLQERTLPSLQYAYNLLDRELALAIGPVAPEGTTGVIVRDSHASGILDGSFSRKVAEALSPHLRDKALENLRKAATLEQIAKERGLTLAQMAMKFCLKKDVVSSVLPNITGIGRLAEYAAASNAAELSELDWTLIDELCKDSFGRQASSKDNEK